MSPWSLRLRRKIRKRGWLLFCSLALGTYLWTTHDGNHASNLPSDDQVGSSVKVKRRSETETNGPSSDEIIPGDGFCERPQDQKGRRSLSSYFRSNVTEDQANYKFLNVDDGKFTGTPLDYIVLRDYIVTGRCKPEDGELPPENEGGIPLPRNKVNSGAREVTIFTQCSLDRSDLLIDLAAAWQSHISVALYIESPDIQLPTLDIVLQDLTEKLEKASSSHNLDGRDFYGATVTISLLFGRRFSVPPCSCLEISYISTNDDDDSRDNCVQSCMHHPYDFLYPINALRNLALSRTKTSLVFSLDVDFLPSTDLYSFLTTNSAFDRILTYANTDSKKLDDIDSDVTSKSKPLLAFVVPSFEFTSPFTKYTVDALTRKNLYEWCVTGEVIPFHARLVKRALDPSRKEFHIEKAKDWCTGTTQTTYHIAMTRVQGMTNYTKWFSSDEMYGIGTGIDPFDVLEDTELIWPESINRVNRYYEPYIVVHRDAMPVYDERFRGYAFNKRAHNMQLQLTGIRFVVLPEVYVVHRWHSASSSKSAVKDEHGIIKQTVNRNFKAFAREKERHGDPIFDRSIDDR